ncbi:hypothetical protein [Streptomyces sp. NPDC007264]|uniref:hypothetical protein n=1 Tax=Streptomyces sp. NPDC007264 TaxID=3364777 RepID=UPI0036DF718D
MAVDQLPGQVREFAGYLNGLLTQLDQGGGWCGVFWQRDPDGMRACLEGREVPPWDVVEALLQDLAAAYGTAAAVPEAERARALHTASLAAYDARTGGRDALGDRLDVMLREQRYAAERRADLGLRLRSAADQVEAESLRLDLAWAEDDHRRATARCAELRRRMAALDGHALHTRAPGAPGVGDGPAGDTFGGEAPGGARAAVSDARSGPGAPQPADGDAGWPRDRAAAAGPSADGAEWREEAPRGGPAARRGEAQAGTPADGGFSRAHSAPRAARPAPDALAAEGSAPAAEEPAVAPEPPAGKRRRRPRGSARFAGVMDVQEAPAKGPAAAAAAAAPAGRGPRGARFAGAAAEEADPANRPRGAAPGDEDRRITAETVAALTRLRALGRSGEAHALLVEAAHWPAARYPLLAAELHRAGLGADWATLLWEAASLPAERLVAAADALTAAGRTEDGEQMLRQGVVRPAGEIGEAVLGLGADGRHREARALLDAYVRIRAPEEAARSVAADPQRLVPLLLRAARGVSEERHWDLVHALRVAGFTT